MHGLGHWATSEVCKLITSWDNCPVITSPEAQQDGSSLQSIIKMHGYKIQPPTFIGEYGTFKTWKHKLQAYMGLMETKLPRLMESSGTATTIIQGSDLIAGAATEEANKWIRRSTDLRYRVSTKSLWDLQATLYQMLSSIENQKRLLSHQAAEANHLEESFSQ